MSTGPGSEPSGQSQLCPREQDVETLHSSGAQSPRTGHSDLALRHCKSRDAESCAWSTEGLRWLCSPSEGTQGDYGLTPGTVGPRFPGGKERICLDLQQRLSVLPKWQFEKEITPADEIRAFGAGDSKIQLETLHEFDLTLDLLANDPIPAE